jgi:hypothetical protein
VLGCGVPASFIDLLLLAAPRSIDEAIAHACGRIAASGQTPFKDGKPVTDALELRTVVEARARPFFSDLLPFLRSVGVAD